MIQKLFCTFSIHASENLGSTRTCYFHQSTFGAPVMTKRILKCFLMNILAVRVSEITSNLCLSHQVFL